MKRINLILTLISLAVLTTCSDDDIRDTSYLNNVEAPTNVSLLFSVTQDNTGLVTMTPSGEGAMIFNVFFGDGTQAPVKLEPGELTSNVYEEGTYTVKTIATGLNGLKTEVEQPLVVSFQAPQNLLVSIENDGIVSNTVRVTATADFGISYEVDFGEEGDDDIITSNIGEEIVYEYQAAGIYTITVTAFSAAIETAQYVEEDFEVTEILAPLIGAPTPPSRADGDVVSIFSDAYTDVVLDELPTEWSVTGFEAITIEDNNTWKLTNLDFLGIVTNYASGIDVSAMETLHIDYWVPSGTTNELLVKIVNTIDGGEDEESLGTTVAGSWQSVDIDMTSFEDGDLANTEKITQLIIDSDGVTGIAYIDNFYFYKAASGPPPMAGTWKMAAESGSLGVGEGAGNLNFFSCDDACVAERACYFDDTFIFGADGTFRNVLGAESWIEEWQGGSNACGTPVAPHDGSAIATYTFDNETGELTVNGVGAYIGIPKVFNGGELTDPNAAPASITYNVTLSENNTRMTVLINVGGNVFWQYILERFSEPSPLEGSWVMAPESGSLGVGEGAGNLNFFSCDDACVADRGCYFDDTYVFGSDGSFSNILGDETWVEGWQGGSDSCGTPVAPHDGSADATYTYNSDTGELTIDGTGAYIGLAKVFNGGELSDPNNAPNSITYDVVLTENDTRMTVLINVGGNVFWQYKLNKI